MRETNIESKRERERERERVRDTERVRYTEIERQRQLAITNFIAGGWFAWFCRFVHNHIMDLFIWLNEWLVGCVSGWLSEWLIE